MTLYECLKTQPVDKVTLHIKSKNLVMYPYKNKTSTINGVTFTVGTDGSIKVAGAANGNAVFKIAQSIKLTINKRYVLSGYREGNPDSYMVLRDTSTHSHVIQLTKVNQTQTFIATHPTYELYIQLDSNIITEDYDLYFPQLEEGTQATDYVLAPADRDCQKVVYTSKQHPDVQETVWEVL